MPSPDFKKLLHFVAESEWVIGLHQSREYEKDSDDPADHQEDVFVHGITCINSLHEGKRNRDKSTRALTIYLNNCLPD
jgi:hypothetical protein